LLERRRYTDAFVARDQPFYIPKYWPNYRKWKPTTKRTFVRRSTNLLDLRSKIYFILSTRIAVN